MLAEERLDKIIRFVNEKSSLTIQELMAYTGASESTIRRDLNTLDSRGDLIKVYGGAISAASGFKMYDDNISERRMLHPEEKKLIAKYAASLIKSDDFVFIDAGTTTEFLIDYITEKNAIYVTNAVAHARRLGASGFKVYLPGGRFKSSTEAIVGHEACTFISKYNFTIGFWGTNGINVTAGFTTPEVEEAEIKHTAIEHCKKRYILADSSKFGLISPITFAEFKNAIIITDRTDAAYSEYGNIIAAKN